MVGEKKIKVVNAKVGLDDHYRGIVAVSEAFRNAGMEVVYLGAGQKVEGVVKSVLQEDADVLGMSFLMGGHLQFMRRILQRMKEEGLDHVLIVIGGIIPDEDIPKLKEMGVAEVFLPGTPMEDMVNYVSQEVEKRRKHANR